MGQATRFVPEEHRDFNFGPPPLASPRENTGILTSLSALGLASFAPAKDADK